MPYPIRVSARRVAANFAAYGADHERREIRPDRRALADRQIWQEIAGHLRTAEATAAVPVVEGDLDPMILEAAHIADHASVEAYIAAAYTLVRHLDHPDTRAKAHRAVRLTAAYCRKVCPGINYGAKS